MLHMLQWLYTYISSVCSKCFISFSRHIFASVLSRCCICFHTCKVFSAVFLQVFHTHVSSVSAISYVCCKCFIWMFQSRSGVATSVSNACFMCFICLQTYVASVASGYFKSRSSVASLSSLLCCLTFTSVSPSPPPGAG